MVGAFLTSSRYLCLHWAMTMKNRKLFNFSFLFRSRLLLVDAKVLVESIAEFPLPCFFG